MDYKKDLPFDVLKMISAGITKKGFYGVDELDEVLDIYKMKNIAHSSGKRQGEIIFVVKKNGEMVLSPRRFDDMLPHPVLSQGEDVLTAGIIEPEKIGSRTKLVLKNKTGHFHTDFGSLKIAEEILVRKYFGKYLIELDPHKT